ncbi:MAG: hypothetical protein JXR96_06140 [Deltaproteobacteria bacterium]|nr:hypothetical protein [Deltaproteobacteria bacterium]
MRAEPPHPRASTQLDALSALDWIGLALSAMAATALVVAPWTAGPSFRAMFADFACELPALTELCLSVWFPPSLAVPAIALAVAALTGRRSTWLRRVLIAGAFFAALAGLAAFACGLYAPIFDLAGAVQAY